jgi:hypothetical protein
MEKLAPRCPGSKAITSVDELDRFEYSRTRAPWLLVDADAAIRCKPTSK